MASFIIRETFEQAEPDSLLNWFNPPQSWRISDGTIVIEPEAKTDFWQKTHYGFEADNGHFLYAEVKGDFTLSTRVRFEPMHQYDQAGLMVRRAARAAGCTRLWLITTNDNLTALGFYQKRGFVLVQVHRRAVDTLSRPLKPAIPELGRHGIPIRDEIELEMRL